MVQHKFEEEFRKQLQDREIQPSAESWSKLEAQLEVKQTNKKSSQIWWIAVAACISGVFFLGNYGLNSIDETTAPPQVVEKPVLQEKNSQHPEMYRIEESQIIMEEKQISEKKEEISSYNDNNEIIKGSLEDKNAVAVVASEAEIIPEIRNEPEPLHTEERFSVKLEEVVAQVASEEKEHGEVTEAEVDELLKKAAAEISLEHRTGIQSANVDAESLLWEVEMELERSFRDKVFEILKEGYLRTRTAVANRSF